MSAFESEDAYRSFARAVSHHSRYVRDAGTERFLAALLAQASDKVEVLAEGSLLWRAQVGHDWQTREEDDYSFEEPVPFPPGRMKPLPNRAVEGRANPKGIPHLYLASHRDTALAEVRPWIEAGISAGQFKPVRDLRVVNCTVHGEFHWDWGYATAEEYWDDNVWCDVDRAFSRPVTASDDSADYVPTQIIAELFKSGGFDGVAYGSAVGDGHNVALFDLDAVVLHGCGLYSLKSVQFVFDQSGNPYVVTKRVGESG